MGEGLFEFGEQSPLMLGESHLFGQAIVVVGVGLPRCSRTSRRARALVGAIMIVGCVGSR